MKTLKKAVAIQNTLNKITNNALVRILTNPPANATTYQLNKFNKTFKNTSDRYIQIELKNQGLYLDVSIKIENQYYYNFVKFADTDHNNNIVRIYGLPYIKQTNNLNKQSFKKVDKAIQKRAELLYKLDLLNSKIHDNFKPYLNVKVLLKS